jgi:hypothetical protein
MHPSMLVLSLLYSAAIHVEMWNTNLISWRIQNVTARHKNRVAYSELYHVNGRIVETQAEDEKRRSKRYVFQHRE